MSPAAVQAPPGNGQAPPAAMVPFVDGTYEYSEPIAAPTFTLGAAAQEMPVTEITPGGYLRGVSIYVSGAGGTGGTTAADGPWTFFQSLTLESVDGTPILYPIDGYAWYLVSRYCRPWDGDPALDPFFAGTAPNLAFRMRFFNELRATLGVGSNTDARAQYRLRGTVNTSAAVYSVAPAPQPLYTVSIALEAYAQPPSQTLTGVGIQQLPDGIGLQRFVSHEAGIATNTGNNTVKLNRTGNLIRTHILVFRTSAGVRSDLTSDPIRFRVDNTQLFVESRARRDLEMWYRFQQGGAAVSNGRPTGVYVYPRNQRPGHMDGQGWLPTTEATYLQYEFTGGPAGGTLQAITEDLAPTGGVPVDLENI